MKTFPKSVGVMVLALGASVPLQAAEFESLAWIRLGDSGAGYNNRVESTNSTMTTAQVSDYGSLINLNSPSNQGLWSGRAAAQSGAGYLRTFTQMQALVGGNEGTFDVYGTMRTNGNGLGIVDQDPNFGMGFVSEARAYLRDSVTVNAPGFEGQSGRMELSIAVSGQVYYSHAANNVLQFGDLLQAISASAAVLLQVEGENDYFWDVRDYGASSYFSYFEPEPQMVNAPRGGIATFSVPITIGETYDVELQLFSQAALGVLSIPGGMFSMLSDFHNTAVISGITVFDESDNLITASVLGQDNLDYNSTFLVPDAPELPPFVEIPEPATLSLVVVGGLLALRRRRH